MAITRVDPWVGGFGIDITNKLTLESNATLTVGNGTSTGNVNVGNSVGICTTEPAYNLDVSGTFNTTSFYIGGTQVTATAAELNYVDGVTSNIQTQLDAKGPTASPTFTGNAAFDTNTLFVDATNDRIGVGTTSPAYQLEIEKTGSNAIMVLDRTDGAACFIEGQATRSAFGSVGATPLALAYNSLAVVTIGASGAITVNPDGGSPFTLPTADGTVNQFLQTDGSGTVSFASATVSDISDLTATATELNYTDGVTSNIQTQLNARLPLSGGTMTGNIVMSGAQTVDGRDLSVDGAKLDGIESGATADQTASEILTAIKTVDGASSGLDADLLDGQQGSYYLNTSTSFGGDVSGTYNAIVVTNDSHTHDTRYYTESEIDTKLTDGTVTKVANSLSNFTGNWTTFVNDGGGNIGQRWNATPGGTNTLVENGIAFELEVDNDSTIGDFRINQGSTSTGTAGETITWTTAFTIDSSASQLFAYGSRILTVADEGSGNGLDADTLDGVQGASYLRSDTSDSFTSGTLTISGTALRLNDNVEIEFGSGGGPTDAQIAWSGTGLEFDVNGGPLFLDMGNDNDFYIRDVNSGYANSFTVDVSAGDATALNNVNANSGKLQEGGNALIPAGSIIMYGAASAPSGWLLCEGGAVSRTTYATLFAVISTTYGTGDGSTTFNVPDFRDRAPYGASTFLLGSKTAGEVDVNGQNSTGTGTTGSTGGSTVANTTGSGGPTTHTVTTTSVNSTSDKDVAATVSAITAITDHATHTHSIPSLQVNGHTHSVPALTVTHPGVAVKFIIKT